MQDFCVPDNVVTNDDLSKMMDTTDEWIYSRSGIKEKKEDGQTKNHTSDLV